LTAVKARAGGLRHAAAVDAGRCAMLRDLFVPLPDSQGAP
jgi:hypothetical protein